VFIMPGPPLLIITLGLAVLILVFIWAIRGLRQFRKQLKASHRKVGNFWQYPHE